MTRRDAIADAAIRVLAERGSRGLTHRATDAAAGIATGSTSYYHRTRSDLLVAAATRLADLDTAALGALVGRTPREALVAVAEDALREPGRTRTLARYELVLESTRRSDLAEALGAGTDRILMLLAEEFPETDPDGALVLARDLLAFVDGLLLAAVTGPPTRPSRDLAAAIDRFLDRTRKDVP